MELTLEQRLEALGLGKNEAKVYLAALKLGETIIGDLQRESGLHKQLVYNAAETLQEGRLLTIATVRGRRHFAAAVSSLLETRVEGRLGAVRGLLRGCTKWRAPKKRRDLVRTYSGLAPVQQYYQQSMRTQPAEKTVHVRGVGGQRFFELWDVDSPRFQRFEKTRVERKIPLQLLFFLSPEQDVASLPGITRRELLEVHVLEEASQVPLGIVVWQTHVGFLIYGEQLHVIDIAGERAVRAFRAYFSLVWRRAELVRRK